MLLDLKSKHAVITFPPSATILIKLRMAEGRDRLQNINTYKQVQIIFVYF